MLLNGAFSESRAGWAHWTPLALGRAQDVAVYVKQLFELYCKRIASDVVVCGGDEALCGSNKRVSWFMH